MTRTILTTLVSIWLLAFVAYGAVRVFNAADAPRKQRVEAVAKFHKDVDELQRVHDLKAKYPGLTYDEIRQTIKDTDRKVEASEPPPAESIGCSTLDPKCKP